MPRVLTRCPETQGVVPTRLSMDAATFASVSIAGHALACGLCGRNHVWEQGKAWVEGEPEPVDGLRPAPRPPVIDAAARQRLGRDLPPEIAAAWRTTTRLPDPETEA